MREKPKIPYYTVIPILFTFFEALLFYRIPMDLCEKLYHYDFTTAFDRAVPLIPWTEVIYLSFAVFLGVNYALVGTISKEAFYRLFAADMVGRVISMLIFIFLPTTNVRPEIVVTDLFTWVLNLVYTVDMPANLLPSVHCLVTWFAFIALLGKNNKIKTWYKVFSFVYAMLIFISTMTTKQHIYYDVLLGAFIAQVVYMLRGKFGFYRIFERIFTKINRLLKIE
ncbi:MAG: phosphatidic acid phosphatase [Oscillospiraceae bacterium]